MPTPTPDQDATARVDSDVRYTPSPRGPQVQFAPGTIIAERYRISGILGTGGMGEVYRADDTKLDQAVALKFLPARLARDQVLLARLHDEVRLGRQIAHPNVCRIYDIVDWEGAHFVAMEFVDGEDLSRLLRRIGRLAHDKAVDIARGIAAGLMAAHAKGILHRDLKPANIIIDSHGDSRIMDFGLALAAGEDDGTISGTPAYMAPEQLEGAPATIQSDLYALGLVMYELFTGKRAHNARTLPERLRDSSSQIRTPSEMIRDLDPAVERVILRCLSNHPSQRPRSAREVIESLPGGDPLAAALAAGETPSPRIVAAAGKEGSLSRSVAWSLLGVIAILFGLQSYVRGERSRGQYGPPLLSPEILHDRATAILRTHGVPAPGEPIAAFFERGEIDAWMYKAHHWTPLRHGPDPITYRLEYGVSRLESERMDRTAIGPGRTSIEMDGHGRLVFLQTIPKGDVPSKSADWNALLQSAGFESSKLRATPARFIAPAPYDTLRHWEGTYPGDDTPIRVEAASFRGLPTYLRVTGPWDDVADPMKDMPFSSSGRAGLLLAWVVPIITLIGVLLAWRNLHLRRGDRQGALRMAAVVFVCTLIGLLLERASMRGFREATVIFTDCVAQALFGAAALYLFYIAVEPFIRRRWPTLLIGWARLAAGQVRDPMVGRDVLIGIIGGLLHSLMASGSDIIVLRLTGVDDGPFLGNSGVLVGLGASIAQVLLGTTYAITQGLMVTILLVVFMLVLRKRAFAGAALFGVWLTAYIVASGGGWAIFPAIAFLALMLTVISIRYGLLAFCVLQATFITIFSIPNVSGSWATPHVIIPFTVVALLALWAFRTSLGGQSLLGEGVLGD